MTYEVSINRCHQQAIFDIRGIRPDLDSSLIESGMTARVEKGKIVLSDELEILQLGPRRILVKTALENEQQVEQDFRAALIDTRRLSVVNVSDLYLGVQLTGPDALEVLAHAVPLDLYEFPPGSGTSSAVFSLTAIVICEAMNRYVLLVERSYLDYVQKRLRVCALTGETAKWQ